MDTCKNYMESHHLLSVLDAIGSPAVLLTSALKIIRANHAATTFFGQTPKVDEGLIKFCETVGLDCELFSNLEAIISKKKITYYGCTLDRPDTQQRCRVAFLDGFDAAGSPCGYIFLIQPTITKSIIKGEFSEPHADIIHYLSDTMRSPVRNILRLATLLDHPKTDEEKSQYISGIQSSGKKLLDFLNEQLEKVHGEEAGSAAHTIAFNLKECVHEVVGMLSEEAEQKGLHMDEHYAEALPQTILTDRKRIHRILFNLLGNSVKFTHTGYVAVHVSVVKEQQSSFLKLAVEDTGMGLTKTECDALFDPLLKSAVTAIESDTKQPKLGLSIVQHLLADMGGTISVDSEVGKGSRFKVVIPLGDQAKVKAQFEASATLQQEEEEPAEPRILLVEDELMARRIVERFLEDLGCLVETAATAREAWEMLDKSYDLILLDIGLPDRDGIALSRDIRTKKLLETPIVALTAQSWDENVYFEVGIDAAMKKPITKEQLHGVLKDYISKLAKPHR